MEESAAEEADDKMEDELGAAAMAESKGATSVSDRAPRKTLSKCFGRIADKHFENVFAMFAKYFRNVS